jgi:hypothetical protein
MGKYDIVIVSHEKDFNNIKFIVEQLNKTNGDLTIFAKAISRCLKNYISIRNGDYLQDTNYPIRYSQYTLTNYCRYHRLQSFC